MHVGRGITPSMALSHIRHARLLRSLGLPRRRNAMLLSVLLDFHTYVMLRLRHATLCSLGLPRMRYLRFLMKWALPSYLHDNQGDERNHDDDWLILMLIIDDDGDDDDDDDGDEVDATLWLSVGAYIHIHVNLHVRRSQVVSRRLFPTLRVPKCRTGPGSLWKISCQLKWFWNAKSADSPLCTPLRHNHVVLAIKLAESRS